MKIWKWIKWIYDFNQNAKLPESTFFRGGVLLSSKERKWLCEERVHEEEEEEEEVEEGEKKEKLLWFVLQTKPSIRSPDVLTHHCSSPAGVLQRMLHFL